MLIFDKDKYDNQYVRDHYDRYTMNFPKGEKDRYTQQAKRKGFDSLSKYIIHLLEQDS